MLAFYDSLTSGLVPVRVTAIRRVPENQWPPAAVPVGDLEFTLQVTAQRGCYDRGHVITAGRRTTSPRDSVRRLRLGTRVLAYSWADRIAAAGFPVA